MNAKGAIIVIEDDEDDQFFFQEIFTSLNYSDKVLYLSSGEEALEYLKTNEAPFLILSDVNIPRLNGLELKKTINDDPVLRIKCIPFIFFSTAADKKMVTDIFLLAAQGFFVKKASFNEMSDTLRAIIEYWKVCAVPNRFLHFQ